MNAIAESLPIAVLASGTVLASASDVAQWQDDAATMRAVRDITKSQSNAEALARVSGNQQQVAYLRSQLQDRMLSAVADREAIERVPAQIAKPWDHGDTDIPFGNELDAEGGMAFERARRWR